MANYCWVYGVIHVTSPAGWLPVHRDQLRAQRSVTSMGKLYLFTAVQPVYAFSALTLLVGHREEHAACKNWVMRCWCGHLSGARCRWFAYGPADATASQNPIVSCLIYIQIGFTSLVLAYPGCPAKEAVKRVQCSSSGTAAGCYQWCLYGRGRSL